MTATLSSEQAADRPQRVYDRNGFENGRPIVGMVPPDSLNEVRIDTEIGDDPEQLREIADAVVRGCSIRNARIKSLRKLIKAIRTHPDAFIAPPRHLRTDGWTPPADLTHLAIYGSEITNTRCFGCEIPDDSSFARASFSGDAVFCDANFAGYAVFYDVDFDAQVDFTGTHFRHGGGFNDARLIGVGQ